MDEPGRGCQKVVLRESHRRCWGLFLPGSGGGATAVGGEAAEGGGMGVEAALDGGRAHSWIKVDAFCPIPPHPLDSPGGVTPPGARATPAKPLASVSGLGMVTGDA